MALTKQQSLDEIQTANDEIAAAQANVVQLQGVIDQRTAQKNTQQKIVDDVTTERVALRSRHKRLFGEDPPP